MNTTYVATAGLETAPLQDGSVLYNLKTGKFVMLNRSASFLWTELSSPKSVDDLTHRLLAAFPDTPTGSIGSDIDKALTELKELELVASRDKSANLVSAPSEHTLAPKMESAAYESPTIRVLDEEELLNIFQMTAAEISVASCWWSACASPGCP